MPSLRELLTARAPLLLIDAASTRVQVGWLEPATAAGENAGPFSARWAASDDEAGVAVFTCVEQLGRPPETAAAFVFCDGPGSILGIRTVAMALRAWCTLQPRPVFAYSSLAVVAHALGRDALGVIADARRDSWHHYQIGRGLRRLPTASLTGELVMPQGFRNWTPLPAGVGSTPYSLADLLPRVADADLFLATEAPDAFLHEEPSYVTWTPQIHRGPGEPPPLRAVHG